MAWRAKTDKKRITRGTISPPTMLVTVRVDIQDFAELMEYFDSEGCRFASQAKQVQMGLKLLLSLLRGWGKSEKVKTYTEAVEIMQAHGVDGIMRHGCNRGQLKKRLGKLAEEMLREQTPVETLEMLDGIMVDEQTRSFRDKQLLRNVSRETRTSSV